MTRDCLLFFVKYPEPGKVKTRLAAATSPELAADFYAALAGELLERLTGTAGVDVIVCFAPAEREAAVRAWLGGAGRFLAQRGNGLGERMANAFVDAFGLGYERVILTGSDIPGLTPEIVREGLDALTPHRAVLGPAEDGGYYLVGFHRDGFVPAVFEEAEWGGPAVFDRAVARLRAADREVGMVDRLADVDTVEDMRALLQAGAESLGERSRALAGKVAGEGEKPGT